MTQEDKELLLKDLCARLPYGVKFVRESWNYEWDQEMSVVEILEDIDKDGYINHTKVYTVEEIKPYLRPMESMTEDEKHECKDYLRSIEGALIGNIGRTIWLINWLNAHHFDYRGLIDKGLAIAVTKENNPYKE